MSITYKRPPDINVQITESNPVARYLTGITDENTPVSKLVRHISKPKFTITATPYAGASIVSVTVKCGTGGAPFIVQNKGSYTFSSINSGDFVVTATDSNGMTSVKNILFDPGNGSFIEYFYAHMIPTLYRSHIEDPETPAPNEAVLNIKGSYYNGGFGNPSAKTEIKIKYRYRVSGGSWPAVDSFGGDAGWSFVSGYALSGGSISTNPDIVLGTTFDYTKSYEFQFVICEYINGEQVNYYVSNCALPAGIPIFDWSENDFNFNVPVKWNNIDLQKLVSTIAYPLNTILLLPDWAGKPSETSFPISYPFTAISAGYDDSWELLGYVDIKDANGNIVSSKAEAWRKKQY